MKKLGCLIIFFLLLVCCCVSCFGTNMFLGYPVQIEGDSMAPSIQNGEVWFITKLVDIQKGDLIVYPINNNLVVKRVIGLPGDDVQISKGKILVNDKILEEKYLLPGTETSGGSFIQEGETMVVPVGSYFVLGDNRSLSIDSRRTGFVKQGEIVGELLFKIYPMK